jgi:hypothetical protein
MAKHIERLLGSLQAWEGIVRDEAQEIENYPRRGFEDRLIATWKQAATHVPASAGT